MSNKDDILGEKSEHESYGMLGFHRAQCGGGQALFGSSIKHNNVIMLTLKTASHRRSLHEDWYFADKTLFEVEMSATQFADLITSLNQGDGVPVTIKYTRDGALHRCEEPPFISRGEMHQKEFKKHLDDVYEVSKNLIKVVEEKFETKKSFTKADKQEILNMLRKIEMNIGCNQDFQVEQFDRQMEKTTTEAKGEIEAFFQNRIHQIAQQAMVDNPESILGDIKPPAYLEDNKKPRLKRKDNADE